jgi:hypothetical protein
LNWRDYDEKTVNSQAHLVALATEQGRSTAGRPVADSGHTGETPVTTDE